MAKLKLEISGFDSILKKLNQLNGDTRKITEDALRKTHEMVTAKAEEGMANANLPAGGKYSKGKTLKSLLRDAKIEWNGDVASVPVGFDIEHGGLVSIFLMYGTPKMKKNQNKIGGSGVPHREKRPLSGETLRRAYLLIACTLIFLFIYFGSMSVNVTVIPAGVLTDYPILLGQIVYLVYWLAFAVVLIAYIAYNRAFNRKGVTVDMLPDSWSEEQKIEFIEDGKRRLEKSKWMLSLIIPLLVTIAVDAIYLFTWPMIQNLLNIK